MRFVFPFHSLSHTLRHVLLAVLAWTVFLSGPLAAQEPLTGTRADLKEITPAPTVLERIDSVFARAVSGMETVLFYRLVRMERLYVVFAKESVFVRERGSEAPFVNLDPDDDYPDRELTDAQVRILSARKELLPGQVIDGEQRNYSPGLLGGRPVEYVVVKRSGGPDEEFSHGTRFAYDEQSNQYVRIQQKRNLLDRSTTISPETVEEWARQGALKLADPPPADRPPYLHAEALGGVPIVVGWLVAGALFFTLYMKGFNIWGFRHALDVVRGRYSNPHETGEVTHFQALSSALSATVGLGNIAGVTIAMTLGGPGAFFWMLMCGLLGMSTKFVECTLGQKYRLVKPDGTVLGGPMRYLSIGLKEMKLGTLGAVLAFAFTVMCILASFGGGNMFQANQAGNTMLQMIQQGDLNQYTELTSQIEQAAAAEDITRMEQLQAERNALSGRISRFADVFKIVFGVVFAFLVGIVIIGGIKRIGAAAARIVPTMCLIYVLACLFIIFRHITEVPALFAEIFMEAFNSRAMGGGIVGVLVVGMQRAAFSNEAGAGSAAIAHSAARTEEPIREGCVALLEPFIDTIVVCSMTALVILITGAWDNNDWVVEQGLAGAALTSRAFEEEIKWFPYVLSLAVTFFAYSTIISWSYYGERAWEMLLGARSTVIYKFLAVTAVFVGTVVNLGSVLDFSDMMILGMAFPNIAGVVLLAPKVKQDLFDYWARYKAGQFPTHDGTTTPET
jgi:alanine or glycine:cation symporter, AGCS family